MQTIEQDRGDFLRRYDIEVIGGGNTGDKARQLIDKTPMLRQLGFATPRRVILAQDFLDPLIDRVHTHSFRREQRRVIDEMATSFGDSPLVIRSSAEGDARGNGIYRSEFTHNRQADVNQALLRVIESYFSESAIAFRRDARTGEGFGVIVDPLIGQVIADEYNQVFAPILSGFGYTSTLRGEGYINVVPGIGGGVETRNGERITRSSLEPYKGRISEYAYRKSYLMARGSIPARRSSILGTTEYGGENMGFAYHQPRYLDEGCVRNSIINFTGDLQKEFSDLNMFPLFGKMQTLEQTSGMPQYFEWAMTFEDGQPRYWIVQIADVDKKLDNFDFESFGQPVIEGHTVTGSDIKDCTAVVYCPNKTAMASLREFNRHNKGYLLIYSSQCTTTKLKMYGEFADDRLSYADISNASALLEVQNVQHQNIYDNPVDHFLGKVEKTDKVFGVIGSLRDNQGLRDIGEKGVVDDQGFIVYYKNLRVVASERQNRIVVHDRDT